MVKRGEGAGRWEFMVVQISIDPKTKKPDMSTFEMQMVFIDDNGKAHFPKLPNKNGKANEGATAEKPKQDGNTAAR